jgi:hypothetical protein
MSTKYNRRLVETTGKFFRTSSNTEFLPPTCQDGEYSVEQQVFETLDEAKLRFTLALILIAIFANI